MKAHWLSISAAAVLALSAAQANAEEGLELAKKSGCLACHSVEKKVVGPAWQDVSNKYKKQKKRKQQTQTRHVISQGRTQMPTLGLAFVFWTRLPLLSCVPPIYSGLENQIDQMRIVCIYI